MRLNLTPRALAFLAASLVTGTAATAIVIVSSRSSSGEGRVELSSFTGLKVSDACGNIVVDKTGKPVTVDLPLRPPPLDSAVANDAFTGGPDLPEVDLATVLVPVASLYRASGSPGCVRYVGP